MKQYGSHGRLLTAGLFLLLLMLSPLSKKVSTASATQMEQKNITRKNIQEILTSTEALYGISPNYLKAICIVESNLDVSIVRVMDTNNKYSYGICQVQEAAMRDVLGIKKASKRQLNALSRPRNNVHIAALYLVKQYRRYGSWDKAAVAYNAGRYIKSNKYLNKVKKIRGALLK